MVSTPNRSLGLTSEHSSFYNFSFFVRIGARSGVCARVTPGGSLTKWTDSRSRHRLDMAREARA